MPTDRDSFIKTVWHDDIVVASNIYGGHPKCDGVEDYVGMGIELIELSLDDPGQSIDAYRYTKRIGVPHSHPYTINGKRFTGCYYPQEDNILHLGYSLPN